jgi:HPt (histidine-containing phosphotransfer) domain-containing protein
MELDKSKIREALGFDDDLLKELFGIYLKETEAALKKLESSFEKGDYRAFADICHSIKGSSGNLRITLVEDSARTLEKMAKEPGEPQAISVLLQTLIAQVNELRPLIDSW